MIKSHFRFSTDILKRLGEELNPNLDQGILELIKNSYDANATSSHVELNDVGSTGGSVRITDDGDGMDQNAIVNGWFVLGSSGKSTQEVTRIGRIPSGNKGLGRLAALRLGTRVMLTTRPRDVPDKEFYTLIDWEELEKQSTVEEFDIAINERPRPASKSQGTDILISNLRRNMGRVDVKRLARALILLADPFGIDPSSFSAELESEEFSDLAKLVKTRYFDQAEYYLRAELDENGSATASIMDWKKQILWKASHSDISRKEGHGPYKCPAATFEFWAFVLDAQTFQQRNVAKGDVQNWLQHVGGTHVYLNGLRVPPYGNPDDDWLGINLSRAKSPELRPSTNTSIGKVAIKDLQNKLPQKTDRSGFIEGEPFRELVVFLQDCLEWLAKERLRRREELRATEQEETESQSDKKKRSFEEQLDDSDGATKEELRKAFEAYDKSREREVSRLKREIDLYRTLSTAGITAATFAHESSGNPIKILVQAIGAIRRRCVSLVTKSAFKEKLEKPISAIEQSTGALSTLSNVTLSMLDHSKRRASKVDINQVVTSIGETFAPFFSGRDVELSTKLDPASPYTQGSIASLESIITNLINNSLVALESNHKKRLIYIQTVADDGYCIITVADNGPGVVGIRPRDMWLPGQTTRQNGTGLGLTIVADSVRDLGGSIRYVDKSLYGGAEFEMKIPIIR